MDEAENDEADAGRGRVNVDGAVLRLLAILAEILPANASVIVALRGWVGVLVCLFVCARVRMRCEKGGMRK